MSARSQNGGPGRWLSLVGGLLVIVAFFLPAAHSCDRVDYPFEYPQYAPFFAYGLLVVALMWRGFTPRGRASRRLQSGYGVLVLGMIVWALALWLPGVVEKSDRILALAVCLVLAGAAAALLQGLRADAPVRRSIGRSTWTGALGAAQVPVIAAAFAEKILYGLWVMSAGLALALLGGLLIEREARVTKDRAPGSSR